MIINLLYSSIADLIIAREDIMIHNIDFNKIEWTKPALDTRYKAYIFPISMIYTSVYKCELKSIYIINEEGEN
jgi:hypothetical protein